MFSAWPQLKDFCGDSQPVNRRCAPVFRHGRACKVGNIHLSSEGSRLSSRRSHRSLPPGKRHRRPQMHSREWEVRGTSLSTEEREAERRKTHLVTAAACFPDRREIEATATPFDAPSRRLKTPGPFFRGRGRTAISRRRLSQSSHAQWQSPVVGPDGYPRPPESVLTRHSRRRRSCPTPDAS
jgi:hypothetical protein